MTPEKKEMSYEQTEKNDLETIETLLERKRETDSVIVAFAASLQARWNLLNEAVAEIDGRQQTADSSREELATKPTAVLLTVFLVIAVFIFGQYTNEWRHQKQDPPTITIEPPPTVRPAAETLEEFVARSSAGLSIGERGKLIAVTKTILAESFDTPDAFREEFYYQRLKAGLHDSPAFNAFWNNWAAKVQETAEENVESMRTVYGELLRGLRGKDGSLQTADGSRGEFEVESAAVSKLPSAVSDPGEPVEGFLNVFPSIITSPAVCEDEPVSPDFVKVRNQELGESREQDRVRSETSNSSLLTPNSSQNKQRIFNRRR